MIKPLLAKYCPAILRDAIGHLNKHRYRGTHHRCPICLSHLRLFLPLPECFKVTITLNAHAYTADDFETLNIAHYLCPVCRCSDRDRLGALYLMSRHPVADPKETLIHFAPERSLSRFIRQQNQYDYLSADLLMAGVDVKADITDMRQYADSTFDCFICSHVLEHVTDDRKALQELSRILKPGGWGILMSPIIPALEHTYEDFSITTPQGRLRHFGQEDHVRVYAKRDFVGVVQAAGFHMSQLGIEFFGYDAFEKCGISTTSVLYVVNKQTGAGL